MMKSRLPVSRYAVWLVLLFAGFSAAPARQNLPERIVSLSPSVTEILFALEQGHRVVGVSRYCDFPEAVQRLPRVGGFVDPDYEAIVKLKPDLVILLASQSDARRDLHKLGVAVMMVPHRTLEDVHESILSIGAVCGEEDRARKLVGRLRKQARRVSQAVAGKPRPRVLLCIGRGTSSPQLGPIYVAGRDGFFDRLITLAGGVNACREGRVAFPQLSAEGVIRLNPDVIVDLINIQGMPSPPTGELLKQWQALTGVAAVRRGRIYVWTGTRALRPGPRYAEFLTRLARLLHPQAHLPKPAP